MIRKEFRGWLCFIWQRQSILIETGRKLVVKMTKLVIGIASMVAFIIIMIQSFAAGIINVLQENMSDSSGTAGIILGVLMLAAGIVGVITRSNKIGGIVAGVIFLIGAIVVYCNLGTYGDLIFWSILSTVFGLVFLISSIRMPQRQTLTAEAAPNMEMRKHKKKKINS